MARPPRLPQGGPSIFDADDPTMPELDDETTAASAADGVGVLTRSAPAGRGTDEGRSLIVEADGGSRGNPGPAAYGALVRDAVTGEVLNTEGLTLGVTTNNVAEYSALVAGLEMARQLDPAAAVEVRMDSRLVVEQMAGRWKVKHPAMKPLYAAAQRLVPSRVSWIWVPREQNKAADALVNAALDGNPRPRN
jgi:probable phosphoglycerate mutase